MAWAHTKKAAHSKRSRHLWRSTQLLVVILISWIALPASIAFTDFRTINESLPIQINRLSPAYAALEDSRRDSFAPVDEKLETSLEETQLVGGTKLSLANLELETNNEPATTTTHSPAHLIQLDGMTISRAEPIKAPPSRVSRIDEVPVYAGNGRLASVSTRKERLKDFYSENPVHLPSVQQKAAQLVQQELERRKSDTNPLQKTIVTRNPESGTSSRIFVAGASKPRSPGSLAKQDTPVEEHGQSDAIDKLVPDESTVAGIAALVPDQNRNYVVSGKVQLSQGLAFTDQHDISIYHIYRDEILSKAKVVIATGNYNIAISQLKGHLIGVLKTKAGQVIGESEVDLYRLPKVPYNELRVSGIDLQLRPIVSGASIWVTSGRSFAQYRIPVETAKAEIRGVEVALIDQDQSGLFENTALTASSYVMKAEGKNHWGSLGVGISGHNTEIRLYEDKMVRALVESASDEPYKSARNYGIVWGRVTKDGQPISGVKVELAGDEWIRPIYFNGYIPDSRLESTSSDGLFAFIKVNPGIQAVRAYHKGQYLPTRVFPAEANYVSYVGIELPQMRTASIQVVDAFNAFKELKSDVQIVGDNEVISVDAHQEQAIQFSGGNNLMFVEGDAGRDYAITRVAVSATSRHIELPMVNANWLIQVAARKAINYDRDHGTIIGFVNDEAFTAGLEGQLPKGSVVAYFDREGNLIRGDQGQAGGGFIIFNVPSGLHTTWVKSLKGELRTQVTAVEEAIVNVVPVQFH